jgi:hypothetical protein
MVALTIGTQFIWGAPGAAGAPRYDAVFKGDATGRRDVTSALRSFLQRHNGDRVALARNGVYKVTSVIFTARNLKVDFRGSRLRGTKRGVHGVLRIASSVNVTLNQPRVTGTGYVWDSRYQSEHGIHIDGGSDIVLNRPRTRNTRGDGIYIGYQPGKNSPARAVTINRPDIARASRNGIAPVAGQVTIRGGRIRDTGLHGINFEVNDDRGANSIRGVVDGVDLRRIGTLPKVPYGSYAVAAGGYSTARKQPMVVKNVTGDYLNMTIRHTADVVVTSNVSERRTIANFRASPSVRFSGNVRIRKG